MAYALRRRTTADEAPVEDRAPARMTATDRGANAAGSVLSLIARVVSFVFGLIVLVIVAAIVMRLLGANPSNSVVQHVHNWGRDFVGPAHNLFAIHNPKVAITVNWGIAAVVYSIVGGFIARVIARMAPAPRY
jgi:hypothetical protein